MLQFFAYLDQTGFSQWVRDAPTIWAFPTILFVHTLGMAIVAGGSTMIDLIVLGFWPAVPVKPFGRLFPVLWVAFGVNAITGTMMLVADATTKMTTPDFYIKMVLVFVGLYVLIRMRRQIFQDPQLDRVPLPGSAKMLAWASLACWFGAIIAGRLLAYVKPLVSVASAH
jgi:hypothetical protein